MGDFLAAKVLYDLAKKSVEYIQSLGGCSARFSRHA